MLRHGTPDLGVLTEIFKEPRAYEIPGAAAAALSALTARRPLRILDLGGNIGLFALDALSRYPSAEVVSFEPDPANYAILSYCATINQARWEVVEAAAAASNGTLRFSADFCHSKVSTSGIEVPAVDILPIIEGFDYVKMDIEGSEWRILNDPRWADAVSGVTVFVLEWHEQGDGGDDARGIALKALESAEFIVEGDPPGDYPHGVFWAWRSARP